jgi:hypothetical protein
VLTDYSIHLLESGFVGQSAANDGVKGEESGKVNELVSEWICKFFGEKGE